MRRVIESEDVSFFFQAEDGIRDLTVTGVQTCALPISNSCDNVLVKPITAGRMIFDINKFGIGAFAERLVIVKMLAASLFFKYGNTVLMKYTALINVK